MSTTPSMIQKKKKKKKNNNNNNNRCYIICLIIFLLVVIIPTTVCLTVGLQPLAQFAVDYLYPLELEGYSFFYEELEIGPLEENHVELLIRANQPTALPSDVTLSNMKVKVYYKSKEVGVADLLEDLDLYSSINGNDVITLRVRMTTSAATTTTTTTNEGFYELVEDLLSNSTTTSPIRLRVVCTCLDVKVHLLGIKNALTISELIVDKKVLLFDHSLKVNSPDDDDTDLNLYVVNDLFFYFKSVTNGYSYVLEAMNDYLSIVHFDILPTTSTSNSVMEFELLLEFRNPYRIQFTGLGSYQVQMNYSSIVQMVQVKVHNLYMNSVTVNGGRSIMNVTGKLMLGTTNQEERYYMESVIPETVLRMVMDSIYGNKKEGSSDTLPITLSGYCPQDVTRNNSSLVMAVQRVLCNRVVRIGESYREIGRGGLRRFFEAVPFVGQGGLGDVFRGLKLSLFDIQGLLKGGVGGGGGRIGFLGVRVGLRNPFACVMKLLDLDLELFLVPHMNGTSIGSVVPAAAAAAAAVVSSSSSSISEVGAKSEISYLDNSISPQLRFRVNVEDLITSSIIGGLRQVHSTLFQQREFRANVRVHRIKVDLGGFVLTLRDIWVQDVALIPARLIERYGWNGMMGIMLNQGWNVTDPETSMFLQ
ncbi:hypothetical protein MP638_007177 [Amoeboaphelidium occidentale]|nr:hypothetical protein MP638_007177 [Amoeboaphelidium occidentale]